MGTAIMTAVLGAVTDAGVTRMSKTKFIASLGGLNGFYVLLPGVLAKDPLAIGQMVVLLLTWAGTLWARGTKG